MNLDNLKNIKDIFSNDILTFEAFNRCVDFWTDYCFEQDLEVDTKIYDDLMLNLWNSIKDKSFFRNYEQFYNIMCCNLV